MSNESNGRYCGKNCGKTEEDINEEGFLSGRLKKRLIDWKL